MSPLQGSFQIERGGLAPRNYNIFYSVRVLRSGDNSAVSFFWAFPGNPPCDRSSTLADNSEAWECGSSKHNIKDPIRYTSWQPSPKERDARMRSLTRTQFRFSSPTHGPDMILRDGVPIPTCLHSETTLLIHIETEDIHTHTELPAQRDDPIHS